MPMLLVSSCSCPCPIHWSKVLSRESRCSWTGAAPTASGWSTFYCLLMCCLYYKFDGICIGEPGTWTNIESSSPSWPGMLDMSFLEICFQITHSKLQQYLPGADKLIKLETWSGGIPFVGSDSHSDNTLWTEFQGPGSCWPKCPWFDLFCWPLFHKALLSWEYEPTDQDTKRLPSSRPVSNPVTERKNTCTLRWVILIYTDQTT